MAEINRKICIRNLKYIKDRYKLKNCAEEDTFNQTISDMKKVKKIEQIFEIKGFGEYPCTYEDMAREVLKIIKGEK